MIKTVEIGEIDKVFDYIKENYHKCMYLYLNLKKYGIVNPNVKTWILLNNKNDIVAVVLQYFSAMHIYSEKKNYYLNDILELIKNNEPSMICGEKEVVEDIFNNLSNNSYEIERGFVRKLNQINDYNQNDNNLIIEADNNDFYEIAKLIYKDHCMGSSYVLDDLANQLKNRKNEGYARNYIIKIDNKIVSHVCTGAENDKIAMISYVITDSEYRCKGYAKRLCKKLCKDLMDEGKNIYLINYSNESTALYDSIGFEVCGEWARMQMDLNKKQD